MVSCCLFLWKFIFEGDWWEEMCFCKGLQFFVEVNVCYILMFYFLMLFFRLLWIIYCLLYILLLFFLVRCNVIFILIFFLFVCFYLIYIYFILGQRDEYLRLIEFVDVGLGLLWKGFVFQEICVFVIFFLQKRVSNVVEKCVVFESFDLLRVVVDIVYWRSRV